jgi:capsid portal protein
MIIEHIEINKTRRQRERRSDPPEAMDFAQAMAVRDRSAMETISGEVDAQARQTHTVETDVSKAEVDSSQSEVTSARGEGEAALITPIYDFGTLVKSIESSSNLGPIVRSMVANTVGYGYRTVKRKNDDISSEDDQFIDEQIGFENFANYCGRDVGLLRVLEELAWDFYLTGNAFCEIVRSPPTKVRGPDGKYTYKPGRIVGVYRAQAAKMRMTTMEERPHTLKVKQIRRTRDGYVIREGYDQKRFRRFAELSASGSSFESSVSTNRVWFKEFQDNRFYSRSTGELLTTKREIDRHIRTGNLANEMIHFSSPATRGPYGFPYYIGNLSAIAADVLTDNINLATLNQNMIPSMVVLVSGNGALTKGSWNRMTEFTKAKFSGHDNRSRFLVLEAEQTGDIDEDNGNLRIDIKSLHETQKDDQMFQGYRENALSLVRESFRLPEILVGRGAAASGVVVAASMKLADEQVFAQDRDLFVDWINRRLLPEMGLARITIELNSPNATDPATLATLLTAAEKTGSMTPEISKMIIERVLGTDLPAFMTAEDLDALNKALGTKLIFDPKVPFTLLTALNQKRQNEAGENNPSGSEQPDRESNGADPTEPGQTVMASQGRPDGGDA